MVLLQDTPTEPLPIPRLPGEVRQWCAFHYEEYERRPYGTNVRDFANAAEAEAFAREMARTRAPGWCWGHYDASAVTGCPSSETPPLTIAGRA